MKTPESFGNRTLISKSEQFAPRKQFGFNTGEKHNSFGNTAKQLMRAQQGTFYKMYTPAQAFFNEPVLRPSPMIYTIFSKTPKQVIQIYYFL